MKHWPVPNSYSDEIPSSGSTGSFWEDRTDRFHCGVDFFAPSGSSVVAIDTGVVLDKGIFSDPINNKYLKKTYYIVIKSENNIIYKYAELSKLVVRVGEKILGGQEIGFVGDVLNMDIIDDEAPFYIREQAYMNLPSMLHLEMYKSPVMEVKPYDTGNFLGRLKPSSLLDPNVFLIGIKKKKSI